MSALPEGWVETTVEQVCDLVNGRAYKQDELLDTGKYTVLRVGNFFSNRGWYYSNLELEESKYCHHGDLLYAWSASFGPRIWEGGTVIFHYHIWRVDVRSELLEKRFLFHWFEWDKVNIKSDLGTGSTMIHVTKGGMEARQIDLPPLPEQQRIVAKVDALMTRTARARKDLAHIPTLITRYKQRLLALAFSGELIGNQPVLKHNDDPKCWSIPSNWKWTRFDEVAEVASNLVAPSTIPNLPHIAPDNIQSGTGRLLPYRTISEDKLISAKNRFYPGQILYSKIRPYLKKAVIVDFDGACSADMYPINARSNLNPIFLLYWLISDDFAQFSAMHEGRTVLPKINQKALNGTPFPLPPLREQTEIVRRIETAFAWLDRLAAEHTSATKLLPKLDAAILTKAFAGHLVPQNPTDEPASVLLARVKAEREAMPAKGRKVRA